MTTSETGMSIIIASSPEKEKVFAELYFNDEGWAIVSQEQESLTLEIYSNPNLAQMKFGLEEVIDILLKVKRELSGDSSAEIS